MGILEKISEIEKEISRTQKNKGEIFYCFFLLKSVEMLLFIIILTI